MPRLCSFPEPAPGNMQLAPATRPEAAVIGRHGVSPPVGPPHTRQGRSTSEMSEATATPCKRNDAAAAPPVGCKYITVLAHSNMTPQPCKSEHCSSPRLVQAKLRRGRDSACAPCALLSPPALARRRTAGSQIPRRRREDHSHVPPAALLGFTTLPLRCTASSRYGVLAALSVYTILRTDRYVRRTQRPLCGPHMHRGCRRRACPSPLSPWRDRDVPASITHLRQTDSDATAVSGACAEAVNAHHPNRPRE